MSSLINMRHHKHNIKNAQLLYFTVEMDTGKTTS